MKILVAGGAGFIGNAFCRHMLKQEKDIEVVCLDALRPMENEDNILDLCQDKRFRFKRGSIESYTTMDNEVEQADFVVNFSAETHVDRSIADSAPFVKANYLGVHNILNLCTLHRTTLIQISTDEVYGEMTGVDRASEKYALIPNNPYSATKAGADLLIRAYQKTYGAKVITIRPCNNFGIRQHPEKVIPLFITNLMDGWSVPLYGDGKHSRQWMYVEDTARAIAHVMKVGKIGEIYNLNGVQDITNIELTLTILKLMKAKTDKIMEVEDRLGHDRRYCMDDQKIRALGFQNKFNFINGLSRTVSWYQQNRHWWEKRKANGNESGEGTAKQRASGA